MNARPAVPTIYNLTLAAADTEYSFSLPAGVVGLMFKSRNGLDIRWAWATGKVATPTAPFATLEAGQIYNLPASAVAGIASGSPPVLYLATDDAGGDVAEIEVWTTG